jgi:DNA-binding MarR family transcriptional regulator
MVSKDLKDFAASLETLLPRLIRALFNPDPDDSLMELPVAQLRVMRTLTHGDRTVSELSEEFGLSMSACTQMVNRLESMGLVSRRGDEGDRRVRHIGLSEEGRRQVLVGLPQSEQAHIIELLEKLLAIAEDHSPGRESHAIDAEQLEQGLPLMRPSPQEEHTA